MYFMAQFRVLWHVMRILSFHMYSKYICSFIKSAETVANLKSEQHHDWLMCFPLQLWYNTWLTFGGEGLNMWNATTISRFTDYSIYALVVCLLSYNISGVDTFKLYYITYYGSTEQLERNGWRGSPLHPLSSYDTNGTASIWTKAFPGGEEIQEEEASSRGKMVGKKTIGGK